MTRSHTRLASLAMLLVILVCSMGCTKTIRALKEYRTTCKPVYAYYKVQGFDHLPEPDRTLIKARHEARAKTPFAKGDDLEKMAAAFRAEKDPKRRLALARAMVAVVKD